MPWTSLLVLLFVHPINNYILHFLFHLSQVLSNFPFVFFPDTLVFLKNVLFNFCIFVYFPVFLQLLIYIFIALWSEYMLCMKKIFSLEGVRHRWSVWYHQFCKHCFIVKMESLEILSHSSISRSVAYKMYLGDSVTKLAFNNFASILV